MPRTSSFKMIESFGRTLPDVEVTTTWGQPTLKVRGKMFVCMAANKSAEPNTLVVMMDFVDRDALIEDDPGTYYLKEHYLNYPCVLVRLSRVHADALRDLIAGAHRFVSAKVRRKALELHPPKNYQNLAGLLIAPDRTAFRTSSIVASPPGAVPPHSKRVAAGVQ